MKWAFLSNCSEFFFAWTCIKVRCGPDQSNIFFQILDPNPYQNHTDPQHCRQGRDRTSYFSISVHFSDFSLYYFCTTFLYNYFCFFYFLPFKAFCVQFALQQLLKWIDGFLAGIIAWWNACNWGARYWLAGGPGRRGWGGGGWLQYNFSSSGGGEVGSIFAEPSFSSLLAAPAKNLFNLITNFLNLGRTTIIFFFLCRSLKY